MATPSSRFGLSPKFSTVVEKVVENQQDPAGGDLNTPVVSLLDVLVILETIQNKRVRDFSAVYLNLHELAETSTTVTNVLADLR